MPSTILSDNGVTSNTSGIKVAGSNDGILELQTTTTGGTATTAITINTSQAVTFAQTANLPNTFGFKNRIINGAFQIWQRGTTISNIPATGTTVTYAADRWCFQPANTGWTAIAQAVQVSGGGLRVNCTTAAAFATTSDVLSVQQRIEGFNCYDLAGQQVTVSFKVKTNKTGNYGVVLFNGTAGTFGTPQSITVAASEVETTYTLTFSAPASITADNADRLRLIFTLGANTGRAGSYYPTGGSQVNLLDNISNYFEIDDVQLEKGSTATSFDYRPFGTELAMCQRYLPKVGFGTDDQIGVGQATGSTTWAIQIPHIVQPRVAPTGISAGAASNFNVIDSTSSGIAATAINFSAGGLSGSRVTGSVSSGLTAGNATILRAQNSSGFVLFTGCEL